MGNDLPTFDMIGNSKRLLRIIDLIIEDKYNISKAICFFIRRKSFNKVLWGVYRIN